MTRVHARALALRPSIPKYTLKNAAHLAECQRAADRPLPPSVLESYSLEGAVNLLRNHSNGGSPTEIESLGEPLDSWYEDGPRDFLSAGLLHFLTENQGVCDWAVLLSGTDDPPVVIERGTERLNVWRPAGRSFSTFISCQFWDWTRTCRISPVCNSGGSGRKASRPQIEADAPADVHVKVIVRSMLACPGKAKANAPSPSPNARLDERAQDSTMAGLRSSSWKVPSSRCSSSLQQRRAP